MVPLATPAAIALVGVTAVLLGLATRQRNLDYMSQEALWLDAVQKRPLNGRAHVTYGIELLKSGQHAKAEAHFRTAVGLDETDASAQLNLGVALCSARKFDEGISRLERALALNPSYTHIYGNLGEAYASQSRFQDALKYFKLALETSPDDLFLLNRAGWLLATSRDDRVRNGAEAVDLGRRAIRLSGGRDVVSLDTLAAAYAEADRFPEAVATATEAVRVARLEGRADILPEIEARLRLFQAGQKFRE